MFTNSALEDIKRGIDLVNLADHFGVQLDVRRRPPKACCPFHHEKTPSFTAHQSSKAGIPLFHCYGCNKSWDAIAFVQGINRVGFLEAVELLTGLVGVGESLPPLRNRFEALFAPENIHEKKNGEGNKENSENELFRQALKAAQSYFARALFDKEPDAALARNYLKKRGLENAVETWGLGFSPAKAGLGAFLLQRGFPEQLLFDVFLLRSGEDGKPPYEFFRNRLMFPVRDSDWEIAAFVGRSVPDFKGMESKAKYLNSGDMGDLYQKGETLFGLCEASETLRKTKTAVLVEGQIDVVRMHLCGIRNAVGLGGTAFTPAMAEALVRQDVRETVWMLDGDDAGENAVGRAVETCLKSGLTPKVLELEKGQDPASLLQDFIS